MFLIPEIYLLTNQIVKMFFLSIKFSVTHFNRMIMLDLFMKHSLWQKETFGA